MGGGGGRGGWRGADCTLHWAPAPQPWSVLNKGQPLGEGLRGPGENMERPGPEHKAGGWGKCTETTGRDKGAFCSAVGNRGFSAPGTVPLEQQPSRAEGVFLDQE